MSWRQFLKPDWRRVLVFVLLAFVGVFVSLPLSVLEHRSAACSPGLYEKGIMADRVEVVVVYPNVLLDFSVYYLLSCLLVYGWGRFGCGGVVLGAGVYLRLQRFCIALGLFFIFMNWVVRSSFLFAVGFFLLSLPFLADLCLAFIDFRGNTFRYAGYYRLYSVCMFSRRSPYTLEFRRRLLRDCILGNMFVVLLIFLLGFLVFSGVFG